MSKSFSFRLPVCIIVCSSWHSPWLGIILTCSEKWTPILLTSSQELLQLVSIVADKITAAVVEKINGDDGWGRRGNLTGKKNPLFWKSEKASAINYHWTPKPPSWNVIFASECPTHSSHCVLPHWPLSKQRCILDNKPGGYFQLASRRTSLSWLTNYFWNPVSLPLISLCLEFWLHNSQEHMRCESQWHTNTHTHTFSVKTHQQQNILSYIYLTV